MIKNNFLKTIKSKEGIIGIFLGFLFICYFSCGRLKNSNTLINKGLLFYNTELILSFLVSILFGFFLGASIYKLKYFSNTKKTAIGFLGGILGIFVTGCPACSITLASYVGLGSLLTILPFFEFSGIYLKILSIFLLLYANYDILKNLETCKIKKHK